MEEDREGAPPEASSDKPRSKRRAKDAPARQRPGRPTGTGRSTPPEIDPAALIFGLHAAAFALDNPNRRIKAIHVTENAERRLGDAVDRHRQLVVRASPRELDRRLGPDTVHQGVVLDVEPLEPESLASLTASAREKATPIIILDQVTDPHNVGAVLRSAAVFGAAGIVMTHRHSPPLGGALAKAASGALELTPVCLVRNLADAIAYNNHDVDDGIRAGLVTIEALTEVRLFRRYHDAVLARYPGIGPRRLVHETARRMINDVVTDLVEETRRRLAAAAPASIEEVRAHEGPLVAFSEAGAEEHLELKRFLRARVYEHERVKGMREGAVRTLKELFEAFFTDVDLMPPEHRDTALRLESQSGPAGRARAVADYVAGMTDRYAFLEHERVFRPVSGTA